MGLNQILVRAFGAKGVSNDLPNMRHTIATSLCETSAYTHYILESQKWTKSHYCKSRGTLNWNVLS